MNVHFMFESRSMDDTAKLARELAKHVHPGMVITLDGDLGAGKTAFSQAFAKAMGVEGIVSSPTFTIIKEYEGTSLPLYHMDVYRISLMEADDLGLEEYWYGDGVSLVEWAENVEPLLPPERLALTIERDEHDTRYITLSPHGTAYVQLCHKLKENGVPIR